MISLPLAGTGIAGGIWNSASARASLADRDGKAATAGSIRRRADLGAGGARRTGLRAEGSITRRFS